MTQRLKAHAPYLHVLATGNPKQREGVLAGASKELIYCICECALNILRGNVSLSTKEKKSLKRHRQKLRDLSNKKISIKKKRQLMLKQRGGWVTAVLAPILSSLAGLLFR